NLGYQSAWTDFATGRVNMWQRWYNTLTGQFDTRDTVDLEAVPDSVNANRFAYADDNPLTETDPNGQWPSCGWCKKAVHAVTSTVSSAYHATTSYVSSAYSYAYSYARSYASYAYHYASHAYHAVKRTVSRAYHAVKRKVSRAYHRVTRWVKHTYHRVKHWVKQRYHAVKRWVKHTYHKARKWVAHKVHQVKKAVSKAYHKVKQAGKRIVAKTVRVVKKAASKVKDAYNATEKWVKDNKNAIIEVVAIGGAILAGIACTAATAGAGAVACMVGAAAVINLAKDAAEGNIHNWGDGLGSLGTGALQGLAGAAGGAIGGKVASALAGKLGTFAGSLGGRMLSGGVAGGAGDAITQFASTGHVNLRGVAVSAGIGAVFGGRMRGGGGNRSPGPARDVYDGHEQVYFGQARVSPEFSSAGRFHGAPLEDVARRLGRGGDLTSDDLRIDAFRYNPATRQMDPQNGVLVTENNRSLTTLSMAGRRPTNVRIFEPGGEQKEELLGRMAEVGPLGDSLPATRMPITPSQTDWTILGVVHLPGHG
ncbi:MAG TPA: RHS repeat-associated core domain-containing protein, partial [Micromonosporaceae bacterium]|nr:RHS repeat-associated core domain-containing protein [Micromonosporaceae bacterium]